MDELISDINTLDVDDSVDIGYESLEEPYRTLYEILDKIDNYDNITSNEFRNKFDTILWDPETFETVGKLLIPAELQEKYQGLKGYVRDARTIPFNVILNCNSHPFGSHIADILERRIKEMSDMLEFMEKRSVIQDFSHRVIAMIAEQTLDGEEASDVCAVLCSLLEDGSEC